MASCKTCFGNICVHDKMSHPLAQAALELIVNSTVILLPHSTESWDYRHGKMSQTTFHTNI